MSSTSSEEVLYLIFTDVVNSCEKDNCRTSNPLEWRKETFYNQLTKLLLQDGSTALKSIGDALFVTVPNSECKETLANLIEAFISCKESSTHAVNIRAVIHKIPIGKENLKGKEIAEKIKEIEGSETKAGHLINSLPKDIFGIQVNKASRLLSLLQEGAVLLTQDVVEDLKEDEYELDENNKIRIESKKGKVYYIHTPVPINFLKGFEKGKYKEEDSKNDIVSNSSPFLVWHLTEKGIANEARLAIEYKERHSFRLLMTNLHEVEDVSKNNKIIQDEVLDALSINNESFKFYTNFCWNVYDYFEIEDINFSRLSKKEFGCVDRFPDIYNNKPFGRQLHKLSIRISKTTLSATFNMDEGKKEQDFILPVIVMDSYPKKVSSHINRSLYQANQENCDFLTKDDVKINSIEPQTIDIFEEIYLNEKIENFNNENNFLLVFFRYFFDKINVCDEKLQKIFSLRDILIDKKSKKYIRSIFCGRISGMVDAFVLYELTNQPSDLDNNVWEEVISKYLEYNFKQKSLLEADRTQENFYSCSYITSLFLLKGNNKFKQTAENFKFIKLANHHPSSESKS